MRKGVVEKEILTILFDALIMSLFASKIKSKYGVPHLKRSAWDGLINFLGEPTDMDTQQKAFR
jgi:hypothetical protein